MLASKNYESGRALSTLPWFGLREGRLVLEDTTIGPVADVHTHLALSYGRRRTVDLLAPWPNTEHYLSLDRPIDLDRYANQNFDARGLGRMRRDLSLGSLTSGGMRRTHTVPNLVREMAEMGVSRSVLLPIEMPVLSWNAETWLEITRDEHALVCLGSLHPLEREPAARLESQKAAGARGVKLHPAVQLTPADHPRAMRIYRICADIDLPVLWHCGPVGIEPAAGRWCSQLKHYWRAVAENPDTTFVLGHAGALQMELALDLARTYPNVYLEIASQGLANVQRLVREAPPDRLMFGSDWPFYHQALPLAKALIATEGAPEARRRFLWETAAELFGLE